jgi:hypothetical protein
MHNPNVGASSLIILTHDPRIWLTPPEGEPEPLAG